MDLEPTNGGDDMTDPRQGRSARTRHKSFQEAFGTGSALPPSDGLVRQFAANAQASLDAGNVAGNAQSLARLATSISRSRSRLSERDQTVFDQMVARLRGFDAFVRQERLARGENPRALQSADRDEQASASASPPERPVDQAISELLDWDVPIEISIPRPDKRDIDLVREWARHRRWGANGDGAAEERPRLRNRLLAARCGELAAGAFYRSLGFAVTDVASAQLDGASDDWKHMDLRVNGRPVDVKNARRSIRSPDHYSEHIVGQPKHTGNQHVAICGVVSNAQRNRELLGGPPKSGRALILGETSHERHRLLEATFGLDPYLELDLSVANSSKGFFPPWVYDLPEPLLAERHRRVESIRGILAESVTDIAGSLPAIRMLAGAEACGAPEDWHVRFQSGLRAAMVQNPLFLPIVFLFVLRDAVTAVVGLDSRRDFRPAEYRRLLYLRSSDLRWPAGVYDPLKTVGGLIHCLDCAWDAPRGLRDFNRFRLRAFNILQGQRPKRDEWWTLIAYCGGREDRGRGTKCGTNPLVLGDHGWCEECRRLVCNNCGYCRTDCSLCYDPSRAVLARPGRARR